jgi:ADP-ribosylglycohydrolase
MPGHGYHNRVNLQRDYGSLVQYVAPRHPHPESNLYRIHYAHETPQGDILHDRASAWKRPGTHFHHLLQAGENTLMLQLARELAGTIAEQKAFASALYSQRFLDFMLTPGRHRDTYVPENLREFFQRHDRGRDAGQCGVDSLHLGGVCIALPVMLFYFRRRYEAYKAVREALQLTHRGEPIALVADLIFEIFAHVLQGWPIHTTIYEKIGRERFPALAYPFRRWIESNRSDEEVVERDLNTGPHIENSVPLTIYLALKYSGDLEAGLAANAMLGGDSCHRGAVLGALLGAANGCESIPVEWVEGLYFRELLESTVDQVWAAGGF